MRCTRCGAELVVGASTCASCGQPVDARSVSDDTLFFNADLFRPQGSLIDEIFEEELRRAEALRPAPEGEPEAEEEPEVEEKRARHFAYEPPEETDEPASEDEAVDEAKSAPEDEAGDEEAPEDEAEAKSEPADESSTEPEPESEAGVEAETELEPEPEPKPKPKSLLKPIPPVMDSTELPAPFETDPFIGDGSVGGRSVDIAAWRLHTLKGDQMYSVSEPAGRDRKSRKARRTRKASREARNKEKRDTRSRTRTITALVIAGILFVVCIVAGTYALELWGGKTIPNVAGLSQANAEELLADRGFSVKVTTEPSDTVQGHVVAVHPDPGTRVDPGSEINVVVGESRRIPEVVGMPREQARAALRDAGAENIRFEMRPNLTNDDVVLEVKPAAGGVFSSSEEVLVVVSQLPSVPDVVGKTMQDAITDLEHEGLPYTVAYERTDVGNRLKVLRTTPAAGTAADEKGVTLTVGDPLVNYARVDDYFDSTAAKTRQFVESEGFAPQVGYLTDDGRLVARFAEPGGTVLAFNTAPWSHEVMNDQNGFSEVMGDNMKLEGARLVIPVQKSDEGAPEPKAKLTSTNVSEATAQEVMKLCGLENVKGSCTQGNIKLPEGTPNDGHVFYCCYGEMGRNVWTILVRGERYGDSGTAKEVVVTCAPKSTYNNANLSAFGGQPCDFVAYHDEYQE